MTPEERNERLAQLQAEVRALKAQQEARRLQAEQDAEEAEARRKQENAEARARLLGRLEAEKQQRRDEDAAKQAAWWKEREEQARAEWVKAGASADEFDAAWPDLKRDLLKAVVQYQKAATRESLVRSGRYE